MDKIVIFIVSIVIFVGVLFWGWQSGFFAGIFSGPVKPTPLPAGIVFFYGNTCPHCKDVEDYISANKIDQKVKFTSLEIFANQNNAALAYQVETSCKIDTSKGVEVPLVYDGTKCYLGAPDAINFFKTQAGIK